MRIKTCRPQGAGLYAFDKPATCVRPRTASLSQSSSNFEVCVGYGYLNGVALQIWTTVTSGSIATSRTSSFKRKLKV